MIRIVLVGAAGRMGRAIEAAAAGSGEFEIAARVDVHPEHPQSHGVWSAEVSPVLGRGDVVVEFSDAKGARDAAAACAARGVPLVSGSTGLSAEDETALKAASRTIAIFRASNFSLGVAALREALKVALASVPATWDVEIVERHHRLKKDCPSGTALALADDIRKARALPASALRSGRQGAAGPRPVAEVGVHAVRGGSWVGDHQVLLAGEGEWLELRHVAQDRAAFAHGALAAARYVTTTGPGWYTMEDMLRAPGRAAR
jgi:4-hydroxy-tetrahydrodipicolinate reductase